MAKMRVYEVAKHLGVPTKELMITLKQLGIDVKNTFNMVDANLVYRLIAEGAPRERAAEQKRKEEERQKAQEAQRKQAEAAKAAEPQPEAPATPEPERKPEPAAPAAPQAPPQQQQPQQQRQPLQQYPPRPGQPQQQQRPQQQQQPQRPYDQQRPRPQQHQPYPPRPGQPQQQHGRPGGSPPYQQGRPQQQQPQGGRPQQQPQHGRPGGPPQQQPPHGRPGGPPQQQQRPPRPDQRPFPPGGPGGGDKRRTGPPPGGGRKPFGGARETQPAPVDLPQKPVRGKGPWSGTGAPPAEDDSHDSPSKRYDAIKQKGLGQSPRKGQKVTFLKKRGKYQKDYVGAAEAAAPAAPPARKTVKVSGIMSVKELSHEMGVKSSDIIMFLMKDLGLMVTLNHSLDVEVIKLICEQFGIAVETAPDTGEDIPITVEEEEAAAREIRPPVVTIMGHVDHGKTRLLDTIRKTNVIDTESGGITQHIGAYQIVHQGRKITFLDTPGHESFTALRARGAKVTDIAVLVVAADDGVKPQTIEAIDHAKDAGVPILVAINKIDKPDSNIDNTKRQLSEKGLIPEEWGGDTVMVNISAKFNQNINDLLDMIFLVADIQELKANPKRKAIGTVIEAEMDKGKGPSATVLIQNGTLYTGDYIVAGLSAGRIRALENDRGERIPFADPSTPVRIYGIDSVPEAGDQLFVLEDEKTVREIVQKRRLKDREEKLHYENRVSLDDLFSRIKEGKINEFKVIIKGDVQGSIEAITQALENIKHEQVRVKVIRSDVGEVKETDVMLAAAAGAVILTFHMGINPAAHAMAQRERVDVRHYEVIYRLIDEVKMAMAGLLAPEYEEKYTGRASVRQVFQSSRVGSIAGCYMEDGEVATGAIASVTRDGAQLFKGKVNSLKRFKDNVKQVAQGYEFGIVLDGFSDFHVEDKFEFFKLVEKKRETI